MKGSQALLKQVCNFYSVKYFTYNYYYYSLYHKLLHKVNTLLVNKLDSKLLNKYADSRSFEVKRT